VGHERQTSDDLIHSWWVTDFQRSELAPGRRFLLTPMLLDTTDGQGVLVKRALKYLLPIRRAKYLTRNKCYIENGATY
jgi:hypothetical protein